MEISIKIMCVWLLLMAGTVGAFKQNNLAGNNQQLKTDFSPMINLLSSNTKKKLVELCCNNLLNSQKERGCSMTVLQEGEKNFQKILKNFVETEKEILLLKNEIARLENCIKQKKVEK